jgi:hypothetical protein
MNCRKYRMASSKQWITLATPYPMIGGTTAWPNGNYWLLRRQWNTSTNNYKGKGSTCAQTTQCCPHFSLKNLKRQTARWVQRLQEKQFTSEHGRQEAHLRRCPLSKTMSRLLEGRTTNGAHPEGKSHRCCRCGLLGPWHPEEGADRWRRGADTIESGGRRTTSIGHRWQLPHL